MSALAKIKAKQLADANETGENPYSIAPSEKVSFTKQKIEDDEALVRPLINRSILEKVKAKQLEEVDKTGINHYAARDAGESGASQKAPAAPQSLEHYQAALSADMARLAGLRDVVEKAKAKAEMIPTYWPFIADYVEHGDNYPNDVAVTVCIWLFDTLDIERGLDLAFLLIKQNQITPPKFDRDLPTFVCDAMYDWAAALLKLEQPQSASPYLDRVVAAMDGDKWSLSPPVQSKMYVILAKHKNRVGEYAECVALCDKAESVNPEGAGVKGLKTKAQEKLKQQPDKAA